MLHRWETLPVPLMPWVHLTPSFASGGAATVRGSNLLRIRATSVRTSGFRQTWMAKSQSRSGRNDHPRYTTHRPSNVLRTYENSIALALRKTILGEHDVESQKLEVHEL